ncbi:SDR family oxidoreductase [Rhizorhabdus dicambivorans]|uniref:SDR family oxidoreductase n=1 Tax=Rhizorhabdus dicambivorans TaxID=1850238 RepID=UPI00192CF57F|nr:SDR family oxidoreductase [Rhizorhabdus dicambivorans]
MSGKAALVTGASRGIGRGIAERLGRDGATVAIHYGRDAKAAEETVAAIKAAGGQAFPVQADLSSMADIKAMFAALDARDAKVDILVNNAATLISAHIQDTTEEMFEQVVSTNLRGTYFVTKYAIERMGKGGRIINLSSNCTRVAYPEVSVYGLTKAGIENMALGLAQQLGARGITVNTVVPGIVDTDMNASWLSEDTKAYVHGLTALGRLGSVEEIANVVAFLASEQASWVTAQTIEASGGCRI